MNQACITFLAVLMSLTIVPIQINAQEQPPPLPEQDRNQTPPPLPVESQKQYYFEKNHQKVGPLKLQEIRDHIKKGSIKRHTLVWKTGKTDWSRAEFFTELKDTFEREAQAPELPDDLRYKKYLVGVWEVHLGNENQRALGVTDIETYTFKGDGSYSAVATMYHSSLKKRYSSDPTTGRWYVTPINEGRFTLTAHRDQTGLLRKQSFILKILDENTMTVEDTGDKVIRIAKVQ